MLPQTATSPETKVSDVTWILMAMTGLFFDTTGALLNLIPVAGQMLDEGNDLVADGVFLFWFKMNGMKYSKVTVFGSFILKFIPILNILPEYFFMIIVLYMQARTKKALTQAPTEGREVQPVNPGDIQRAA